MRVRDRARDLRPRYRAHFREGFAGRGIDDADGFVGAAPLTAKKKRPGIHGWDSNYVRWNSRTSSRAFSISKCHVPQRGTNPPPRAFSVSSVSEFRVLCGKKFLLPRSVSSSVYTRRNFLRP